MLESLGGLVKGLGGPLIGGAASLIGGLIGNDASARQAAKNRDFQAQQSATAHQREVTDLRAAGLNPILSGTGGSGASTSSGATAQQNDVVTPAVNSAMTLMRTMAETAKLQAEALTEANRPQLVNAQASSAMSASVLADEQAGIQNQIGASAYATAQERIALAKMHDKTSALLVQQKLSEKERTAILGYDKVTASVVANKARLEGKIDNESFGEVMRYINRTSGPLGEAIGSAVRSGLSKKGGGIHINNKIRPGR